MKIHIAKWDKWFGGNFPCISFPKSIPLKYIGDDTKIFSIHKINVGSTGFLVGVLFEKYFYMQFSTVNWAEEQKIFFKLSTGDSNTIIYLINENASSKEPEILSH